MTGYARADMPWLLAIQGGAGVVGALVVGRFLDHHAWGALATAVGIVATAQVLLFALSPVPAFAILGLALFGGAFATPASRAEMSWSSWPTAPSCRSAGSSARGPRGSSGSWPRRSS